MAEQNLTVGRPRLAVVVLSLRAQKGVRAAVRSILDQGEPVELVVVNSGGGDVAAALGDLGFVRVVSEDAVLWPGAARNRGIAATTAPYVAFLAADCLAEPGWVAARVRRHRRGAPSVASAIVNNRPDSIVATAYHITQAATRDAGFPAASTARYGASYARWLFGSYGLFREDMRLAEDTEFHARLKPRDKPIWAAEIRTIHHNPTGLFEALSQHYRRGLNHGIHWAVRPRHRFLEGTRRAIVRRWRYLDRLIPEQGTFRRRATRAVIALSVIANQLGRALGRRRSSPAARLQAEARGFEAREKWPAAAKRWAQIVVLTERAEGPLRSFALSLVAGGRHDKALRIWRELAKRYPDDPSMLVAYATALTTTGATGKALDVLRAAPKRFARLPSVLEAWGTTHRARGEYDAARARYLELAAVLPENAMAALGLLRIALLQRDWNEALDRLTDLGLVRRKKGVLEEGARLAAYLSQDERADAFLEALAKARLPPADHLPARLEILATRNDWQGVLDVLAAHRSEIVADPALVAATVERLGVAGRFDEALQLIDEASAASPGRYLKHRVVVLLQMGRADQAWETLAALPADQVVGLSSASTFTALASAAEERDGTEPARALVAAAAGPGARPGVRRAAIFQAARLDSLDGIRSATPRLVETRPEDTLAAHLATLPPHPDVDLLANYTRQVADLRASRPDFAPDPSFVLIDAVKVAARIAAAVAGGSPFSLIRLGDGEGNLLPYADGLEAFRAPDSALTQRIWWGAADAGKAEGLSSDLSAAIAGADVVGIPDLFRLSFVVSKAGLESTNGRGRGMRGLVAALDHGVRSTGMLTSCHIHQSLGHWGLWDALLPRMGTISLITCHPALGPALEQQFGLKVAHTYLIPPERKHAGKFADAPAGRHYPDTFDTLCEQLSRTGRGQIVLVAAGMLGKIYCHAIKSAGGIALDVGSAADIWLGYNTRSPYENLAYRTPAGVRDGLERLSHSDPMVASIFGLRSS